MSIAAQMSGELIKRSDKVAYYGVPSAAGGNAAPTYTRMQGFTSMDKSMNPKEYTRQYVDEEFERTTVTGHSVSIAFTFDQHSGNAVHADMAAMADGELLGSDTVRDIVLVDFSQPVSEEARTYKAFKRPFAVILESEGDGTDAYAYSGNLRVDGNVIEGTATVAADGLTVTFA